MTDAPVGEAMKRVKDFTYYPLLYERMCSFAIPRPKRTWKQCDHTAREKIEGYGFCKKHADVVRPYAKVDHQ